MTTMNTPGLSTIESMLMAAMERGDASMETGRKIITFREGMAEEGIRSLRSRSIDVADAREFRDQSVDEIDVAGADALVFPEIGVAVASDEALAEHGMNEGMARSADASILAIEPEHFVFASNSEFLRGFASAVNAIIKDIGQQPAQPSPPDEQPDAEVLGATWGLIRCKVLPSLYSGSGIKVAILDTGIDTGHPAFVGRIAATATFVGQPVQDLNGHGTHCAGTAAGPKTPAGNIPRYGIGHLARLYIGKVLTNSGSGTTASVLAGMNWAIANRCEVISMSLGGAMPVQASYTNAGAAALRAGCLIVAAAGNDAGPTGAPANSPTIMSVASLDPSLAPSSFSNFGKIEIAAPGRDVYSSWPRPTLYRTISGTSMATPHVAGCAALWAQTNGSLRGQALWNRLQATALPRPYPATRVGRGLVQAP